jgi:hypothetical protein
MRKLFVLFLLFAVLAVNAAQTYVQKVDTVGNAVVTEERDLSVFLQLFPSGSLEKIANTCASDPSLSCSVSGSVMTTTIDMGSGSGYYSYTTEYGLPFATTTLTVNKLPTDLFDTSVDNVLNKAGLTSGKGSAEPIDLGDKVADAAIAEAWKGAGVSMSYTIVMPDGYSESYDVTELLANAHPITISTQEPDFGLIVLILGVIALAAVAYSFFGLKTRSGKR